MSMQNVEYQGWGVDLAKIYPVLSASGAYDTLENIDELTRDLPIYDYDDVAFVTPSNTDEFSLLVIILAVVPVGPSNIKTYTPAQANVKLIEAACALIESGIKDGITTQQDVDAVRNALTSNIDSLAGYSWEVGPWSDLV